MNDLFIGIRYLLKGFSLIHQKGIRRYAYVPIAINTLLFSLAIWFGVSQFNDWIHQLAAAWIPERFISWIMWIVWPLFAALLLTTIFFTFSKIGNILSAPFNGALSEAVETKLLNQTLVGQSWADILKGAPSMIWNELKKLAYVLLWVIPLVILSIIPILNILAPPLWLYFSSWMLAIDYHDYPMGNHQLDFPQQRALLKQKRTLALGFGVATLTATMIPLINFLVIPAAVAGATALYHDQLKAIENKQHN